MIINLKPASNADDLHCADGELANAAFIFNEPSAAPDAENFPALDPDGMIAFPPGTSWQAMHRPDPGKGAIPVTGYPDALAVTPVGEWLVILYSGKLCFSRHTDSGYVDYGETPPPPAVPLVARPKALPPYCAADGTLPRISITVAAGADTDTLLAKKIEEYRAAVKAAGLHIDAVSARNAWRLADGTLWQAGEVTVLGNNDPITTRTVSADSRDGILYLTVELSKAPFEVAPQFDTAPTPQPWNAVISGFETILADGSGRFPAIPGVLTRHGLPSAVFAVGGRAMATVKDPSGGAWLEVSSPVWPFVCNPGESMLAEMPFYVTNSLRSVGTAAADKGSMVYAFCRDGIRGLTPAGDGSYRDVQLISRHVAVGPKAFAPLPDGTAFITTAGVMKLSGTTVKPLEGFGQGGFDASMRLLYLYKDDALFLYHPGEGGIADHHYAWPDTWGRDTRGRIGPLVISGEAVGEAGAGTWDAAVPVTTRPLKLTNAFEIKKVEEVEAVWADGSRMPLKMYGAMLPGKWHFLGLARQGRMIMRGSGWRLFKIETFAIKSGGNYLLPQIFIKFAPQ